MNLEKHFNGTYGTMYYVTDMKKSVQYYKEIFNLTPESESSDWTTFALNGHRICLHSSAEGQQTNGHGILITSVANLEGMVVELKKRGVEFVKEVTKVCEGGYAADFKDPSGNVISLFEYQG